MTTIAPHEAAADSAALRGSFDRVIAGFLDEKAALLANSLDLSAILKVIRRFVLSDGKRLRPLFCYWGWRGAGGGHDDVAGLYAAAASLELFHSFGLIHDDIMDGSTERRGRLAVHEELTRLHAVSGWLGDSTRFGASMGVLCGDLLLVWSDDLLHNCGLPQHRIRDARRIVEKMRSETMYGQHLDLLEQARGGTLSGALTVIRYKTAKYTVERPLQIGGALAGADPALLDTYTDFALPLGEAFQLRDDVLGAFGDPSITGKSVLDDLRDGKPTVLMALTRAKVDARQAAEIDRWHGNPALDEAGARTLRDIIIATGALAEVERMISDRTAAALSALHAAPVADEVRAALRALAVDATQRTA